MTSMDSVVGRMGQFEISNNNYDQVKILYVNRNITDIELVQLMNKHTKLEEINLTNCKRISSGGFACATFPATLRRFTAQNTKIDSRGVTNLSNLCPNLEYLDLEGADTTQFTTAVFPKTLTTLKVSKTAIGHQGFLQITKCPALKELDITDCKDIDPSTFEEAEFLQNLEVLLISGTRMNNTGLMNLATRCRYLARLDIKKCFYGITLDGIYKACFSEALKDLTLNRDLSVWEKITFSRTYPQIQKLSF